MKHYTLCAARAFDPSEHSKPECTAYRDAGGMLDFDIYFQVWPNRASMLKTCELQGRGAPSRKNWKPLIPDHASERKPWQQALADKCGVK